MLPKLLRLLPARLIPTPRLRRVLLWAVSVAWFAFAALFLTLRYAVLPHVPEYRGDLERALSASIKLPVSIAAIDADWYGLRPRLSLHGFVVKDKEGRAALKLDEVEAVPAWSSLLHFELRLHALEIMAPSLELRRDKGGIFYVAGMRMDPQSQDSGFADWLLQQDGVIVRNATVTWHDEQRGAPPLQLTQLDFRLQNSGSRHRFGLTAVPPPQLSSKLDVRGDLRGSDLRNLKEWRGEAYAALDYADLAVWRTWIDYPIELPRGKGGLSLWLRGAEGRLASVTADVRLDDVRVRMARGLPLLDLKHLAGRIAYSHSRDGEEVSAKQLALVTQDGISIAPTDFGLKWQMGENDQVQHAELNASLLDLATLDRLSAYLPLPQDARSKLAAANPRGQLQDAHLAWHDDGKEKPGFSVKAHFSGLSLTPQGMIPGFQDMGGEVDGNERGGRLTLASRNAVLSMPRVFSEANIAFTALDARLKWRSEGDGTLFSLEQVTFRNADTQGSISGRYQSKAGGLGEIDLEARLLNTDGRKVWRYMPLVVNKDTRDWLRTAITAGVADEVQLRLKGDLDKFPFKDGSGVFQVKGHIREASLLPARGWPQLEKIDGELDFTGVRMLITGKRAKIYDVVLSSVTAEIPDLDTKDPLLLINGTATGMTQEFLKYIETSPVAERINHFTATMLAAGSGTLQLKLTMPLQHTIDTKVAGAYQFTNNRLTVDTGLPPLTEMNGRLEFTEAGMAAKDAHANLLGAPLTANISTDADGVLRISGEGGVTAVALRKQFALPLFDHLSGTARWKGLITVKKRDLGISVDSDLVGIASSLPEPFNKTTTTPMLLRVERKPFTAPSSRSKAGMKSGAVAGTYELNQIVLGKVLNAQLLRRAGVKNAGVERGVIGIGASKRRLPEKGVLLGLELPRLNLDSWRTLLAVENGNTEGDTPRADAPFLTDLDIRASEVTAFNRSFHDASLVGSLAGQTWKTRLRSREVNASLDWTGGSNGAPGHLAGHLTQLSIPDESASGKLQEITGDALRQMPTLALTIDSLRRGGRDLGSLKLDAETRNSFWQAKFSLSNEDGTLSGTGRWNPDPAQVSTHLDFILKAKNIEKLLVRFGHADAVRRGSATMQGNLSWSGAPYAPHYPSLNGNLKLEAKNGQFNKVEPGLGRLLGVVSLQSLPRRISLDFNDVFSEGFAFDSIEGQVAVTRGIMQTQDLVIAGPSAKVKMQGKVDLLQETQDLTVRVQPALGTTLATGMFMVHPVTGAVAWAAQKLLKDPVDQVFAFSYAVTGSWADPKVTKLNGNQTEENKTENKQPENKQ